MAFALLVLIIGTYWIGASDPGATWLGEERNAYDFLCGMAFDSQSHDQPQLLHTVAEHRKNDFERHFFAVKLPGPCLSRELLTIQYAQAFTSHLRDVCAWWDRINEFMQRQLLTIFSGCSPINPMRIHSPKALTLLLEHLCNPNSRGVVGNLRAFLLVRAQYLKLKGSDTRHFDGLLVLMDAAEDLMNASSSLPPGFPDANGSAYSYVVAARNVDDLKPIETYLEYQITFDRLSQDLFREPTQLDLKVLEPLRSLMALLGPLDLKLRARVLDVILDIETANDKTVMGLVFSASTQATNVKGALQQALNLFSPHGAQYELLAASIHLAHTLVTTLNSPHCLDFGLVELSLLPGELQAIISEPLVNYTASLYDFMLTTATESDCKSFFASTLKPLTEYHYSRVVNHNVYHNIMNMELSKEQGRARRKSLSLLKNDSAIYIVQAWFDNVNHIENVRHLNAQLQDLKRAIWQIKHLHRLPCSSAIQVGPSERLYIEQQGDRYELLSQPLCTQGAVDICHAFHSDLQQYGPLHFNHLFQELKQCKQGLKERLKNELKPARLQAAVELIIEAVKATSGDGLY